MTTTRANDEPELAASFGPPTKASTIQGAARRGPASASNAPCATCRGHTIIDRGVDVESGADLIDECPDC